MEGDIPSLRPLDGSGFPDNLLLVVLKNNIVIDDPLEGDIGPVFLTYAGIFVPNLESHLHHGLAVPLLGVSSLPPWNLWPSLIRRIRRLSPSSCWLWPAW